MVMYNGHPVLKNIPGKRMFKTNNEEAVRISLNYEKSEIGLADIYVHKNCVTHATGNSSDEATYDVLLIDNAYHLYYPMRNRDNGLLELRKSEEALSVDIIHEMAERTKEHCLKLAASKVKSSFFNKRGSEFDGICEPKTRDMITLDYLN